MIARSTLFLALISLHVPVALAQAPPARALANDNRVAAGRLAGGVLTLDLEAVEAVWHPDAEDATGLPVHAFAEAGKPAQIPGPLVRVPAHTEVRLSITNRIAGATLRLHGLHGRPAQSLEKLEIPPGETRTLSFSLAASGTYLYWGATTDSAMNRRARGDTQLSGAIVVDEPDAGPVRDRVFVITQYLERFEGPGGGALEGTLLISAINGKSWPHTERSKYAVGDTVRWRWINTSFAQHPMHLHGFYYRVDARGNGTRDSTYAADAAPRVVTDRMPFPGTIAMTWVPERAGNWIFHCHVPAHVEPHLPVDGSRPAKATHSAVNHTLEGMGGLVIGIEVSGPEPAKPPASPRRLRLLAVPDSTSTSDRAVYRFRLDRPDARARAGIGLMTNPILVLKRGEPVAITVVNKLPEPTAVHWHGIELESYFDGVAGFGGTPGRIAPLIMPRDSFIARFTPPRAGTFIYHTHVDEPRQEIAGLAGVIAVVEDLLDARTDHSLLVTMPPGVARGTFLVNGSPAPAPLQLRAGARNRLRVVNMMVSPPRGVTVSLMKHTAMLTWRPLAKDGADLPMSAHRPASVQVAIGETYDYEIVLNEPGRYRLRVTVPGGASPPSVDVPVHVTE